MAQAWFVGVGINRFKFLPGNPLRGCGNDTKDCEAFASLMDGVDPLRSITLFDEQATAEAELDVLGRACMDMAVDDVLFYQHSSHGALLRDGDPESGVVCCYDFDNVKWDGTGGITADQYHKLFTASHGRIRWLGDHCHAGRMERDLCRPGLNHRFWPRDGIDVGFGFPRQPHPMKAVVEASPNVVALFACDWNQTAADALVAGRWNGAATAYLLTQRGAPGGLLIPAHELARRTNVTLDEDGYSQRVQLVGDPGQLVLPFNPLLAA